MSSSKRREPVVSVLALGMAVLVAALAVGAASARAASGPPFEPVKIQRINLPSQVTDASTPVFTRDGKHLLFFSGQHMWIVGADGSHPHCLTCGLANEPTFGKSEQSGIAQEFPDQKRVFMGGATMAVLECTPSVIDCSHRQILPVNLDGSEPNNALIPPGGVDAGPAVVVASGNSPKLSPDGQYIAFSALRSDMAEVMILTKLIRTPTQYITSDPRVLNPPGPTSATDLNTAAWSNGSALYEFKTFIDGGADVTYVQVGGVALGNPDVWKLNLATGQRTRLTSYPDWDEDDAPSPNGQSLLVESDRGMHRTDMLGDLMPVRDFIDAPEIVVIAGYFVADAEHRQCDLQPWLLPATGDRGGYLMGQPIQPYTGGPVHGANNVAGYPQWNQDGTEIALNTESFKTNLSAPYLLVAHLLDRKPTAPIKTVSSAVGSWAPDPNDYHGPLGGTNDVVLHGLKSGTATVDDNDPAGLLGGTDSVVYHNYSDNGRDFVNGTYSISDMSLLAGPVHVMADITMSGADTGYIHTNATFSGFETKPITVTGTSSDNYDGKTISGIPHTPQACPASLPRPPRMRLTAHVKRRAASRTITLHLTASIAQAGPTERSIDTRPVTGATIRLGRRTVGHTASNGRLTVEIPARDHGTILVHATAGQTLVPAVRRVRVGTS